MCGIAGAIEAHPTTSARTLASLATSMVGAIEHRGPDRRGAWADEATGVCLGFCRLAILDLSPAGDQPMHSASGRWTIVYNGELYNHRAIRNELEASGTRFRGSSDTEVLLAAIDRWGVRPALERTNGMFAFAAWDHRDRRLTLVRDRLGEKPLYYGWAGRSFVFASELKALRAHPDLSDRVDREALSHYLRRGYVPAPWTILEGVAKLAAGTLVDLDLDLDRLRPGVLPEQRRWWSVTDTIEVARGASPPAEREEVVERLDALLRDSVALRLEADVPVGAFLSGGIDSSTVVALAAQHGSVRTFSVRLPDLAYDESEQAAAVARHLGTEHTTIDLPAGVGLDTITSLSAIYDEPFGDPSAIPSLLVSRAARREVTVALGGDGGDEVFVGYNRHVLGGAAWSRVQRIPVPLRRPLAAGLRAVPPGGLDRLAAVGPLQRRVRNPGDKLARLQRVVGARSGDELQAALVDEWDPALLLDDAVPAPPLPGRVDGDAVDQLVHHDLVSTLPDQMLVKVDRASMAASLEVRTPLLDHRLLDLVWSVPPAWNQAGGVGKRLLRGVLDRYVPAELVDRPKIGFDPPIAAWLRGPLRPWAEDLLTVSALQSSGLRAEPVRALWRRHLAGGRSGESRLWTVLQYQAWAAEEGR